MWHGDGAGLLRTVPADGPPAHGTAVRRRQPHSRRSRQRPAAAGLGLSQEDGVLHRQRHLRLSRWGRLLHPRELVLPALGRRHGHGHRALPRPGGGVDPHRVQRHRCRLADAGRATLRAAACTPGGQAAGLPHDRVPAVGCAHHPRLSQRIPLQPAATVRLRLRHHGWAAGADLPLRRRDDPPLARQGPRHAAEPAPIHPGRPFRQYADRAVPHVGQRLLPARGLFRYHLLCTPACRAFDSCQEPPPNSRDGRRLPPRQGTESADPLSVCRVLPAV